MARRYRLLCPISRALDVVGDRWTLLILRDLYAGPVRHGDLAAGLTGISSNLLATRLKELVAEGLVRRTQSPHGVALYALTDEGRAFGPVLFELAKVGTRFPPDPAPREPGNVRLVAVTLEQALLTLGGQSYRLELRVDGQALSVVRSDDTVTVRYTAMDAPDAVVETAYVPLVQFGDGVMDAVEFGRDHVRIRGDQRVAGQFLSEVATALRP